MDGCIRDTINWLIVLYFDNSHKTTFACQIALNVLLACRLFYIQSLRIYPTFKLVLRLFTALNQWHSILNRVTAGFTIIRTWRIRFYLIQVCRLMPTRSAFGSGSGLRRIMSHNRFILFYWLMVGMATRASNNHKSWSGFGGKGKHK